MIHNMVFRILEKSGPTRNKKNIETIYYSKWEYKALTFALSTSGRKMSHHLKILVMVVSPAAVLLNSLTCMFWDYLLP